jgi:hypothetical protein
MINKENEDEAIKKPEPKTDEGFIDIAKMDVQCHVIIKDKDTGDILVNKRG